LITTWPMAGISKAVRRDSRAAFLNRMSRCGVSFFNLARKFIKHREWLKLYKYSTLTSNNAIFQDHPDQSMILERKNWQTGFIQNYRKNTRDGSVCHREYSCRRTPPCWSGRPVPVRAGRAAHSRADHGWPIAGIAQGIRFFYAGSRKMELR
jgi:hypothetical protein